MLYFVALKAQPKTLLISEIEPGQRYELVCTTDSGLVRYRLGDVVYCTRYLSQADNTVPLPFEQEKIPRIPLVSIAYRVGNLISITGENTTEQHVMDALQRTVQIWKQQEINVDIYDFTLYPKLDTFPSRYVMFLELFNNNSQSENKIIDRQQCILLNDAMSEIERQLCEANDIYKDQRNAGKIGSLICILVRKGTFSIFLNKILVTTNISPTQVKPHRLLKNTQHIQFFYDNKIDAALFS
ncbi:unnamed protein product [Rotaria sp. Silwood1]|nr:unnamed protein product [Rotaria sp. Silwood1]